MSEDSPDLGKGYKRIAPQLTYPIPRFLRPGEQEHIIYSVESFIAELQAQGSKFSCSISETKKGCTVIFEGEDAEGTSTMFANIFHGTVKEKKGKYEVQVSYGKDEQLSTRFHK